MMSTLVRAACLAILVAVTYNGGGEAASRNRRDNDHERARSALQRGEILPIARILALVAQYLPGDIIEVELDERRGQFTYEIKVLTPEGQVRDLVLDARTGAYIRIED